MRATLVLASCSSMMVLAICWAPLAAAVLGPNNQASKPVPPAGWVPPVLAKLNPSICNYKTGQISAADLARVKRQATAAGLQFDEALPVNCWYKFKQAGSAAQTQKALATLTLAKKGQSGQSGAVAVSSSGEPLPFALAEYDQLVTTMQPAGPSIATGVTIRPQDANSALKASSGTTKVSRPNHSTSDSLQVVKAAGAGSNTA